MISFSVGVRVELFRMVTGASGLQRQGVAAQRIANVHTELTRSSRRAQTQSEAQGVETETSCPTCFAHSPTILEYKCTKELSYCYSSVFFLLVFRSGLSYGGVLHIQIRIFQGVGIAASFVPSERCSPLHETD